MNAVNINQFSVEITVILDHKRILSVETDPLRVKGGASVFQLKVTQSLVCSHSRCHFPTFTFFPPSVCSHFTFFCVIVSLFGPFCTPSSPAESHLVLLVDSCPRKNLHSSSVCSAAAAPLCSRAALLPLSCSLRVDFSSHLKERIWCTDAVTAGFCVFRLYRTKCVSFRLVFARRKLPVTCWCSSCSTASSRRRAEAFRRCAR